MVFGFGVRFCEGEERVNIVMNSKNFDDGGRKKVDRNEVDENGLGCRRGLRCGCFFLLTVFQISLFIFLSSRAPSLTLDAILSLLQVGSIWFNFFLIYEVLNEIIKRF